MQILGLDIGAGNAVAAVVSAADVGLDVKALKKIKTHKLDLSAESIAWVLAQSVGGVVLEPTGGHYSRLWVHRLQAAGLDVRYVGHREVANFRHSLRLSNKSDALDAIALALYGVSRWQSLTWFVDPQNQLLRDLVHQHRFFNRLIIALKNRIRQQLQHECPEIADVLDGRSWGDVEPGRFWRDLAGECEYYRGRAATVKASIGTGVSEFTRLLSKTVCSHQRSLHGLEQQIGACIALPVYQRYSVVFDKLAMPVPVRAALLTVIHPFDRFLEDGKPIIEYVESKKGKRCKRNRSLSAFKLTCGMGTVLYQSGGSESHKSGGSSLVRQALWLWIKMAVVLNHESIDLPEVARLRAYYLSGSTQDGKYFDPGKGNQRVMRTARRGLERLFQLLAAGGLT